MHAYYDQRMRWQFWYFPCTCRSFAWDIPCRGTGAPYRFLFAVVARWFIRSTHTFVLTNTECRQRQKSKADLKNKKLNGLGMWGMLASAIPIEHCTYLCGFQTNLFTVQFKIQSEILVRVHAVYRGKFRNACLIFDSATSITNHIV